MPSELQPSAPVSSIRVYNTLSRREQPLTPIVPGQVGIYLCGPTVYDDCHIGHLMGPVLFDAIARWLTARGLRVHLVNNITDIDDKIINRALATGEPWESITERYTAQYFAFLTKLHAFTNLAKVEHPRCSAYIASMIGYITELIAGGRAYAAADGVYFDVQRQPGYGKLSGRKIDDMQAGARIERDASLHHPADFALWKLAKPGEPSWPSPWGAGRPGWHIECSVMSHETLGATFDIHGGGDDLKFPHHENEIAQGEAHGGDYAHCWMHNGLIQYEGVKVGKSDPRMKDPAFRRQFDAAHLLETYGAATIRFLLLQGHYRRPIDFAPAAIISARTALGKLHKLIGATLDAVGGDNLPTLLARALPAAQAQARDAFAAAMDDDFNTGAAIAQVFTLASEARKQTGAEQAATIALLRDLGRLLGLFQPGDGASTVAHAEQPGDETLAKVMALVLELRQQVRANRDFATSDRIRDQLKSAGIVVKDAKDGASWGFG